MTYIFIIQGEGRGHMTQAISLAQALGERGHSVLNVLIGTSPQREIPSFLKDFFGNRLEIFRSPNFIRIKDKKGIHIGFSFLYNFMRIPLYLYEIIRLSGFLRRSQADRIINFYDAIGGMAYKFSFCNKSAYVISHHYFLQHPDFHPPGKAGIQGQLLKFYSYLCALGAESKIALSFTESQDIPGKKLIIVPPLLRIELYKIEVKNESFCLVYLLNPGMISEIEKWCISNPEEAVWIFTDSNNIKKSTLQNLNMQSLAGEAFINALAGCKSLVCTSGFETVAESAYLGKKVLLIPSKNHFEQLCNALDAERAGLAVKSEFFDPGLLTGEVQKYDHGKVKEWFEKNPGMVVDIVTA